MSNVDREALLSTIADIVGRRHVEESTCLYHDLRISGDDALELLDKIHKTFGTTFNAFNFAAYFPNEGEVFGYQIARLFGRRDKFRRFTFRHLLEVVRVGHWFEGQPEPE